MPGPGTYRVALDVSTLPEGVALRNPDRSVLEEVEVRAGQHKSVVFALGERVTDTAGWATRLANLIAKGLTYGAIVALASVGLSLIFGVTGLVNFAHGELVTFGAVVAWFFNASAAGPGLHLLLAILPALVLSGLMGAGLERGLFRPLRRRRTGNVSLIVVSIGLSLLVRHIYLHLHGRSAAGLRAVRRAVPDLPGPGLPAPQGRDHHRGLAGGARRPSASCSATPASGRPCEPWPTTRTWPRPRASAWTG